MSALLQPGFVFLFAVVGFFVFLKIGAKEDYKTEVSPLTRRIMLGIIVAIATFGVFTALQQPQRDLIPVWNRSNAGHCALAIRVDDRDHGRYLFVPAEWAIARLQMLTCGARLQQK